MTRVVERLMMAEGLDGGKKLMVEPKLLLFFSEGWERVLSQDCVGIGTCPSFVTGESGEMAVRESTVLEVAD